VYYKYPSLLYRYLVNKWSRGGEGRGSLNYPAFISCVWGGGGATMLPVLKLDPSMMDHKPLSAEHGPDSAEQGWILAWTRLCRAGIDTSMDQALQRVWILAWTRLLSAGMDTKLDYYLQVWILN
jgi:hypothetical protein